MKLIILMLVTCLLASCSKCQQTIKVAATSIPHAEILNQIKPELQQEGICLKIIEVDDYALANRLLAEKQVDANFFQHRLFLQIQKEQFGYSLAELAAVHFEPLGIYSKKITDLQSLPIGAKIAIPSDPSNEARALYLLQAHGLITLKQVSHSYPTIMDIECNPKKLKIQEIDAAFLPRALPDVSAAIIPANFALQGGLVPNRDALILECQEDSPYINIVVVRDNESIKPELLKLKQYITSEKIECFIAKRYAGSLVFIKQ